MVTVNTCIFILYIKSDTPNNIRTTKNAQT